MASSNSETDIPITALNNDNTRLVVGTTEADNNSSRMGKPRGCNSSSEVLLEETPTSRTETMSIGGMSRNGPAHEGFGVSLDNYDDVGYEQVRSCGVGAIVDFDNGRSIGPGVGNDKGLHGVCLTQGTVKASQNEEDSSAAAAPPPAGDELHKEQRSVFSSSVGTNPQTPPVQQQQQQQQQQQLPPPPTVAGRLSLASASSVGSSFHSVSRGSLQSLGMSRTPTGSRKIMVSNLPRHSRRNKKTNEMTWLRDTLSLTSSTHSKEMMPMSSYHDSGSDFQHLHHSSNDVGNQSSSSDNDDGNDELNDSNGEFGVCERGEEDGGEEGPGCMNGSDRSNGMNGSDRDSMSRQNMTGSGRSHGNGRLQNSSSGMNGSGRQHQRTSSSPAFLGSLQVPELFPKAATLPLPSIMACSMSSQSDEGSSSSSDGGGGGNDEDDEGKPETIHEGTCERGSSCEGCRELEKLKDDEEDSEEEEQDSGAPIKWITATIPSGEEEQLPPPPPRRRSRRSSPSPPRSRSPAGRDRSPRSRGSRKERWGGQDKTSYGSAEQQRRRPPRNWSPPPTETIPRGSGHHQNIHDSGEGRSVSRRGDNRGEASYPPAPRSVARSPTMGVASDGNDWEGEECSRYGYRSGDAPSRGRPPNELRDNSYSRQEEQSIRSSCRYDSPSRYGERGSRYPPRDRHDPRTTRELERYPPRYRSPERYPPGDRSPERYPPRDRSPERYAPEESPSVFSRRENSPPRNYSRRERSPPTGRYSRRDGSPELRSSRHHRTPPSDWGPSPQTRHGVDERSVYSRAPGERRGYTGEVEEPPYRRGEDERSVYSRRREDPYERDYSRRREDPYERDYGRRMYDSDPYHGQHGSRHDRRLSPRRQENDRSYPRERNHPHYHSELHGRRSHRESPRHHDPYHHERSAYSQDEDRNRYGRGVRSYPRRGYSMDDPAYDDYPGPPPIHDNRPASPYHASRYDHQNDRYNDHHSRYNDHYTRPSPRQQDPVRNSRYGPPPPAPAPPRQTNQNSCNSDQAMLEEKLRSSGRGMDRGSNGGAMDDQVSVEISPGVHVPLRRTHETMQAIAVDFYQSVSCLSCTLDVFCIADVSYVICPTCRVISPVTGQYFEGRKIRRHGLGLGFTCESLFKMQSEIMQDRSMNGKSERNEYGKQERPKQPTNDFTYERRERASISTSHY